MAGFRKAVCKQAAIKMSMYGPPGSGKTFSALLFAEGIGKAINKRVAVIDTELGTSFYCKEVPERNPHPEAFDFDALYTRSLTEVLRECRNLNPAEHGIIVLDSISHLWDAAMGAYTGPKTKVGGIPMHAWSKIKAPYKELMRFLIDSPFHVFILGRQANVFEEDSETGETKAAGFKMRAEGETAYEPHVCLRMTPERTAKQGRKTVVHKEQVIAAFAEKDRTGIIAGRLIQWPTFENVIAPMLAILSGEQAATPSEDEAATQDAEALQQAEKQRAQHSHELAEKFKARIQLAEDQAELKAIAGELTPAVKKEFTAYDLAAVRTAWAAKDGQFKGRPALVNGSVEGDAAE